DFNQLCSEIERAFDVIEQKALLPSGQKARHQRRPERRRHLRQRRYKRMQTAAGEMASTQYVVELLLNWYKHWMSRLFSNSCRFTPSCSEYAAQAVVEHGWARGGALAARRLLRCHPFAGSGYVPVPQCY